jgi:hypothetical protein
MPADFHSMVWGECRSVAWGSFARVERGLTLLRRAPYRRVVGRLTVQRRNLRPEAFVVLNGAGLANTR